MAGQDESHTNVATPHSFRKDTAPIERGAVLAGRYQIETPLGRGGAGVVLRAFDRELREAVAIKVLHADLAQEARWIERLAREVKLARQLRHPNVCRVFDFERADGHAFIVMELAAGGSLRRELEDQARPARSLAERMADANAVAAGLAAIHESGVAHRDVTPQNILRMADGRLVVSDFGLATEISQTTTSIQGGTVAYMAPEVVRGQRANFASDVWSLGVVIHEIVFGARPTWSKPVGGAMLTPAPGRTLAASERLAYDVCRACTADQPSARPQSAGEVAARLRGERRRPLTLRARWFLLSLAVAVAGAGAILLSERRTADGLGLIELSGVPADWTATSTIHATFEGRLDCMVPIQDGLGVRYVGGRPKRAEDLDLRSGRRAPTPFVPATYEHGCPSVSPDGAKIAYQGYVPDGRAFAFVSDRPDGSDGRPAVAIADPSYLSDPKWVGRDAIAIDLDYLHVGVYSLEARRTTVLPDLAGRTAVSNFRAVFGSTIVLIANRTNPGHAEIVGYEWPTLAEVLHARVPVPGMSVGSPDERSLFLPTLDRGTPILLRLDPARRTLTRLAAIPGQMILFPTFLPDRLAFVSRRDLTDAWRRRPDGQLEQLTHDGQLSGIAPCGRGFIAVKGGHDVYLTDAAGRRVRDIAHRGEVDDVVCSPDGKTWYAVTGTPTMGIARCSIDHGTCDQLAATWPPFIALSPNGERLAIVKPSPAGYLAAWFSVKDPSGANELHEVGITESNCKVSWGSDRTLWVSKRRNGRLLWLEVDVETQAETGKAVEGLHTCANSVPDPQSPGNRDLRLVETSISEIRSVPLSAVGVSAAL